MDTVQEQCKQMNVKIQNLHHVYHNSRGLEILNERLTQLNVTAEEYKETFIKNEYATQLLNDMQKRLYIISAPTLPMQYDLKALGQLQNEIAKFSCFLGVDPDARDNQLEDISYILRVTKLGEKWEDKDKTIQTLNNTVTELNDQLKDKNRLILLMQQENNVLRQNLDEQMKLKFKRETQTREQDDGVLKHALHSLSEKQEATVFNNTGTINIFHSSAKEMPFQFGDHNRMINSA